MDRIAARSDQRQAVSTIRITVGIVSRTDMLKTPCVKGGTHPSFRVGCARWMGTGCCHGDNSLRLFDALAVTDTPGRTARVSRSACPHSRTLPPHTPQAKLYTLVVESGTRFPQLRDGSDALQRWPPSDRKAGMEPRYYGPAYYKRAAVAPKDPCQ